MKNKKNKNLKPITIYHFKKGKKRMENNELRLSMIVSTFRDKLQDLGEEDFITWVEKTQFPKKENE